MCFQTFRRTMTEIVVCHTSYACPSWRRLSPSLYRRLISRMSSAVKRARQWTSPKCCGIGAPRPLARISSRFARCVPRKRWSGRTQSGLSQVWQTFKPSGIGPCVKNHAIRLARFVVGSPWRIAKARPHVTWAYPCTFPLVHIQQVGVLFTFAQNSRFGVFMLRSVAQHS